MYGGFIGKEYTRTRSLFTRTCIRLFFVVVFVVDKCGMAARDIERQTVPTFSGNEFSILHQNVCGLKGKKDEIRDFLIENNIKIFGISETLLTQAIPSSLVNIRGYIFERSDRVGNKGGGIGVYVKEGIEYIRRYDLDNNHVEAVWFEVQQSNSKSFVIGHVYRPPDSSKHLSKCFNKTFLNILSKLNIENKECIVLGDMNINYLNNSPHALKDSISLQGFQQLITKPTRVTKDSETLIDVILSNRPEMLCNASVLLSTLSDHDVISVKRKVNNVKWMDITIQCRDYSKYNHEIVKDEISAVVWDEVLQTNDTNTAWIMLKNILSNTIDKHAPQIHKRVKGKRSPWINRDLKKEMNKRDAFHRRFRKSKAENDHAIYKQQRNRTNILIRKAKRNYNKNLLRESAKNSKKFWSAIKTIFPAKGKSPIAKSDNKSYSKPSVIASKFCSYFTNVATSLKQKTILLKDFVWSTPFVNKNNTYTTFRFKPVTVNEIFKQLKQLQRNKAAGVDNIPPGFLKDISIHIAIPLAHVINLCLKYGTFPNDFKIGKVTPIYKNGSKHNLDNYRPITVLVICSKILEKVIHNQLMCHLENHKLLSKFQFGFRRKRSTELAVTIFMDSIRKNMDQGKLTGAIFIDLSKAFDTLSHSQIISNLSTYGIHDTEQEFFVNYLFNRKQQVYFQNTSSNFETVNCGVPQGSILGPLLFLMTFNNLEDSLTVSDLIMYADDTVIYTSGNTVQEIQNKLSMDFQKVGNWLESNDLIINMKPGKTECMVFGTKQKIKNKSLDIQYRYQKISTSRNYKYLGVDLDQSLTLTKHNKETVNKAIGRLNLMRRLRPQLTTKAACTIYQSMLLPLFTYCSIITCHTNNTHNQKIESFERRAKEIIFKGKPTTKLQPISHLMKKRLCELVYKCIHNDVCVNMENYFDIMNNNTRNRNIILRIPKIKLESTKKSFYFSGARAFNNLPPAVRGAESLLKFLEFFNK
jgi:exonuclease III